MQGMQAGGVAGGTVARVRLVHRSVECSAFLHCFACLLGAVGF
jgi:hypothetical protein